MRRAAFASIAGVGLLLAAHCGGDGGAAPGAEVPDGGAEAAAEGAPPDTYVSPYGFDARPPNPSCRAPQRPTTASAAVKLERVYAGVTVDAPVVLTKRPGVARWYVVEQAGRIRAFDDAPAVSAGTRLPPRKLLELPPARRPDRRGNGSALLDRARGDQDV